MPFELKPLANPVRVDDAGAVWAGQTRMPFVQVIEEYKRGLSVEVIAAKYPGTPLQDLYGAIAYYHQYRDDCETLMAVQARERTEMKEYVQSHFPMKPELIEKIRQMRSVMENETVRF